MKGGGDVTAPFWTAIDYYGPVLDRNRLQLTPTVDVALDALQALTGAQT